MATPDRAELLRRLEASEKMLTAIGLRSPSGFYDRRHAKKLEEVLGFSEQVLAVVADAFADKAPVILDCSCGKSYLSFVLNYLLADVLGKQCSFIGTDTNPKLIARCDEIRAALGFENMEFHRARTIEFMPGRPVDIVLALHACDTATDEAIAKGIQLGARYILVVPCCQNQIRGQIKAGHPLVNLTEFGPIRYALANLLTDALRALFLRGAGYDVKLNEIVPPKLTPKNIMILARRMKKPRRSGMADYERLRDFFDVHPRIEDCFPPKADGVTALTRPAEV
ncbi:MAG: SAM-dependent methyltransferase [Planctomycetes bacterium]|nr:SAM-dependent methyltransferase [Planctomycetota bacterium]MBM4078166.1 SAM-dependent methyltransferase [Planctomycetota bacterium]MBM4083373.1 SAM-dependent methyltransferase [Planctomycetota bacterium]